MCVKGGMNKRRFDLYMLVNNSAHKKTSEHLLSYRCLCLHNRFVNTGVSPVAPPVGSVSSSVQSFVAEVHLFDKIMVLGGKRLPQKRSLTSQLTADALQLVATVTFQPPRCSDQLPRMHRSVAKDI